MKRILLTGFEPFGDQVINPSERLTNKLSRTVNGIEQLILPVSYEFAFQAFQKHYEANGPFDMIVMLGQAGGRKQICLERFAHNWMENKTADKTNPAVPARKILPDQPDALMTTLALEELRDSLNTWLENKPVSVSHSAGAYVCNDLYFKVLMTYKAVPAVFIHVPLLPEQLRDGETSPTMDFDTQLLVLTTILESLKK